MKFKCYSVLQKRNCKLCSTTKIKMKSGKGWPKTKRKEKDLQVHMYPCMRTRGSFDSLTLKEERQVKNSKEQRQNITAPQNLYVRLSSSSFVPGRSLLKEMRSSFVSRPIMLPILDTFEHFDKKIFNV